MKLPLAGGAPVALATGLDDPNGIAVDGTSVYWTNLGGTVMKLPLAGGAPVTLAAAQSGPQARRRRRHQRLLDEHRNARGHRHRDEGGPRRRHPDRARLGGAGAARASPSTRRTSTGRTTTRVMKAALDGGAPPVMLASGQHTARPASPWTRPASTGPTTVRARDHEAGEVTAARRG